jgi:hypothetical protein
MRHVRTEHDAIGADHFHRFGQVLVFFTNHVNVAVAENLARLGPRMAETRIVFED